MPDPLLIESDGPVRVLTMNRPEARNALSGELIRALYAALVEADEDSGVRVVVLTGSDPAFCAGVDLKEAARDGAAYFAPYGRPERLGQVALPAHPGRWSDQRRDLHRGSGDRAG